MTDMEIVAMVVAGFAIGWVLTGAIVVIATWEIVAWILGKMTEFDNGPIERAIFLVFIIVCWPMIFMGGNDDR